MSLSTCHLLSLTINTVLFFFICIIHCTKFPSLITSTPFLFTLFLLTSLSMATSKALIASIVLSLLVLDLVQAAQADQATGYAPTGKAMNCKGACATRCSLSSRPNLCNRACGTCCSRCQCVPPGTSGNYDACPCYATMTTRNNQRKCP